MALSDINYVEYQKFLEAFSAEYGDDPTRPTGFELESMFAGWLLLSRIPPAPKQWIPELGEDVLVETLGVCVVESFDHYVVGDPTIMNIRVRAKATRISTICPKDKVRPWRT